MSELLVKLVGGNEEQAGHIAGAELALRGQLGTASGAAALLILGVLVWWLYRYSPTRLSAVRKYSLGGLRLIFFGLLLLLLMRPVLALTIEGQVRRLLLLLIDTSSSMQIKDPRPDPDDQRRAAIAEGFVDPKRPRLSKDSAPLPPIARVDLVKAALTNVQIDLVRRLEQKFDLQVFSFGRGITALAQTNVTGGPPSLSDLGWVTALSATNPITALGDALRDVVRRKRGQSIAGVVLVSDGANNSGIAPADAAAALQAEAVPVYAYGVGVRSPRDILLANVFAPDVSFADDDVHVTVRVRSQGLKGESASLELRLGNETVAAHSVELTDDEQIVPLTFMPRNAGTFDLVTQIEPRADEAIRDNNFRTQRLRVIDSKIKVLLVDQSPRWEFRYLQAMLLRDRRVQLKCFLVEADPAVARDETSPYLPQFPPNKEELFKYDVVILGDVDPKVLSLNQLEMLGQLVADFGGGLVVIAGRRAAPHAYRQTILERLLPVELDALALPPSETISAKPIRLELTAAGRASPMLRLSDAEIENVQLWKELPPVFWLARTARAKPAAEVLLVDPDPGRETRYGKMPAVALQQYGLGQVMYVGTDNSWRWRKSAGGLPYITFWGQTVQRLALQRFLGGSKRTQLATDRQNYLVGDRVPVYARLYGTGFEPIDAPSVSGTFTIKTNALSRIDVILRPVPEQRGLYRGEFVAPLPGQYQFQVEQDPATTLEFSVAEPQFEFGESSMNEPLLRELASKTGGAFFREEDLFRMPDSISARSDPIRSSVEVELWSSPVSFLLLLIVVGAEWWLRKRWNLK